jgi:primosomal protein N' (replication factor Y)
MLVKRSGSDDNPSVEAGAPVRTVQVALPVPLPTLFDYLPPAPLEHDWRGCRVRVPFGHGERIGIVVGTGLAPAGKLKPVSEVLDRDPVFDAELWRTLTWAAGYYHYPLGEVLAAGLPAPLRNGEPWPTLDEPGMAITTDGQAACNEQRLRPGPGRMVLEALQEGPLGVAELRQRFGRSGIDAGKRLLDRGWVQTLTLRPTRRSMPALAGPPLHAEQSVVIDAIDESSDRYRGHLLEGITGSGKTEVYLNLIARVLVRGQQALVLVPEIALTPQALRRYRERLTAPVLPLHSGLGERERARAWAQARSGEPCVVLGTRSAVFTPLPAAGLIIVDEEHDGSYKQGDGFRYHARDLALVRGKTLDVPVVLGSATPSLESLALANEGRLVHHRLSERRGAARLPALRLVDLRNQRLQGGLAPTSLQAVREALARGEQALVFRNRRGFAPAMACRGCGHQWECPRCDRPYTLHRQPPALICHHCGQRARVPSTCPACGSTELTGRGLGTERIEVELTEAFPGQRIVRIDRDSMRAASRLDAALSEIEAGGPAILIGTQLLAKGHDWPMLSLVVIADADAGLLSPDFRAPEHLAQLLTQVAGRAGRGDRPGTVLVQTRQPQHPFWPRWLGGGYPAVAAAELAERREGGLPPYRHQALLAAEARGTQAIETFFREVLALPGDRDDVTLIGPLPAPMPKRAGHHRQQLLLECASRQPLHRLLSAWLPALYASPSARRVRWSLDVDPLDMY